MIIQGALDAGHLLLLSRPEVVADHPGDGATALLANRHSAEQDEQFVAGMRAQFGL